MNGNTTGITGPGSDELDEYLAAQMRDPGFVRWWHRACAANPPRLPVNGREYHRRQLARKKRRR